MKTQTNLHIANSKSPALWVTKHAVERFIERTNSPMAIENAKACVIGLVSQFKESDLIQWDERSKALRSLFGIFIITAGYVVTFLSWTDLPPYRRKALQNLVLAY